MIRELSATPFCGLSGSASIVSREQCPITATAYCSLGSSFIVESVERAPLTLTAYCSLAGVITVASREPASLEETVYCSVSGSLDVVVKQPILLLSNSKCSLRGSLDVELNAGLTLSAVARCSLRGSIAVQGVQPLPLSAIAHCSLRGVCDVTSLAPITAQVLLARANCSLRGSANIYSRSGVPLSANANSSLSGTITVNGAVPKRALEATAHCSLSGSIGMPSPIVILLAGANASLSGSINLVTYDSTDPDNPDPYNIEYAHFLPQPAIDPWNWLACKTGFGSTFEGFANLNLEDGTDQDPSPLKEDVQCGIRQTHFLQWNPAWLATQEDPPTYDPTYAAKLQRLAAVLGMQEQVDGSVLDMDAIGTAMVDSDGNSLGWLYFWDLQRTTGDDVDGKAALHVGYVSGLGLNMATIPQTVNCYWSTHGRGQGMTWDDETLITGDGGSEDSKTDGIFTFWKRPVDDDDVPTGPWEAVSTFSPDTMGRWRTPPARETGYIYSTSMVGRQPSDTTVTFSARQYANAEHTYFTLGGNELYVVEHLSNCVYVFDYQQGEGIHHIFTSDAGAWFRDGKAKCGYALPKLDVADENTQGSPAGYVDSHGVVHLYYLMDNDLKHITSTDWCNSWSAEATVITGDGIEKASEINSEGRQYCFGVNSDGNLFCYTSAKHFVGETFVTGTNKFLIVAGADTGSMPIAYEVHGKLYCYTFVGADRKCYRSLDFGKTWAEETAPT